MNQSPITFVNDDIEITKDEEEELITQANDELQNIGDINDIVQPIPEIEKLNELKKLIDTLPREQVAQLMEVLANENKNSINPNGTSYSSISPREMLQIKLKQKKDQFRHSRMTQGAKKIEQAKNEKDARLKKIIDMANEGTSNEHDHSMCADPTHNHNHNHDHNHEPKH